MSRNHAGSTARFPPIEDVPLSSVADTAAIAHNGCKQGECMSGFEVLLSFYGLLLGLAVANVTSSFADTWRRRGNWKMGIVPPLLGLLILLAAAQQWSSFWGARDVLTMGPWEVLTAMGMALPYIFISHAMFPVDLHEGGSLEDHYMQQSPVLAGALLAPPLVSLTYNLANLPSTAPTVADILEILAAYSPQILMPVVLLLWRNRWAHTAGMAMLCTWMVIKLFA